MRYGLKFGIVLALGVLSIGLAGIGSFMELEKRQSSLTMILGMLLSMLVLGSAAVIITRTLRFANRDTLPRSADERWSRTVIRYTFAVLVVALATVLRVWLIRWFGPMPLFVTWYPAVLLVASIAGGGPGVAATLVSVLAVDYWFIAPFGKFGFAAANDAVATGIFAGTGIFLSVMAERLRRARWAEAVNATQEQELALLDMGNLMALDLDHRIVRWSEGCHRLYGFEAGEARGRRTHALLKTHCPQPEEQIHRALLEQGYWEGELTRCRKDGMVLSLAILLALRRDEKGNPQAILEVSTDITRQKIVDDSLRRAKEEWERTFDSVPDLITILDNRHRIVRVNKAMAERLGKIPADCVGLPCYRSVHGTDCPPGFCPHTLTLADGLEHAAEVHEKRLGGDFLVSTTPLHDAQGQLIGTVHVARDITERKVLEAREREALSLATASQTAVDALDAMGEGVLLADRTGRILSINPALERMSGFQEKEVAGQPLETFIPQLIAKEERKIIFDALRRAFRGEPGTGKPFTLIGKGGRGRVPVLSGVSFIRNPDGQPTAIVVTLRDVSEIQAVQKTLEESERKYRELIENANSIIMRITPDHDIAFFNEYAEKFFGYKKEEVLGRNVVGTIVSEMDSQGRDLKKMMREITVHPELHGSNENENTCKNGRRVWIHWANRAIRDDQGSVKEILCVGTDITERRRMEAENLQYQHRLRGLAEQLAASEEQERWQLSRYIHDTIVQNLSLSSIKMGTLLNRLTGPKLAEEVKDLQTTRKLVNEAIGECRIVMSELTPSLLYELGLVSALADLADKVQERHGIRVCIEEDGGSTPMDTALRGLLFQSARELIMNALKHAGPCEIRVTVTHRGNSLVIGVQDDGKGFDPIRLDHSEASPGGFGLFSIRERIEGFGGRLDIQSAPGCGTKATISVPVAGDGKEPA